MILCIDMKELKALPIGISSFEKIRQDGDLYVDKTKQLHEIVRSEGGRMYFLSRPRRFGKSLLCDTIKQLFSGKKELFKGLWIEGKWDFAEKKFPVIHIIMRETKSIEYKHQIEEVTRVLLRFASESIRYSFRRRLQCQVGAFEDY